MKPHSVITLIAFALIIGATSLSAGENCLEQLEQKCTGCHYNTRICKKLDKKNRRAWAGTVKRMLRYGLKLDEKEQADIVNCLLDLKDDSNAFCK